MLMFKPQSYCSVARFVAMLRTSSLASVNLFVNTGSFSLLSYLLWNKTGGQYSWVESSLLRRSTWKIKAESNATISSGVKSVRMFSKINSVAINSSLTVLIYIVVSNVRTTVSSVIVKTSLATRPLMSTLRSSST